jgi:transcription antitermination factor NusG
LPILPAEPDCHPEDLLDSPTITQRPWWLVYTRSRQEKQLMRRLRKLNLDHYAPQITKRQRSPAGRVRITYQPLFVSYVFLCGDEESRYQATCTGCVMQIAPIEDAEALVKDLRQIQRLIHMDVPLSIESRLEPGQLVRVKNGSFAGYEGTIVQRMQETRLIVCVRFMEQGVSVKLDDCQLELL